MSAVGDEHRGLRTQRALVPGSEQPRWTSFRCRCRSIAAPLRVDDDTDSPDAGRRSVTDRSSSTSTSTWSSAPTATTSRRAMACADLDLLLEVGPSWTCSSSIAAGFEPMPSSCCRCVAHSCGRLDPSFEGLVFAPELKFVRGFGEQRRQLELRMTPSSRSTATWTTTTKSHPNSRLHNVAAFERRAAISAPRSHCRWLLAVADRLDLWSGIRRVYNRAENEDSPLPPMTPDHHLRGVHVPLLESSAGRWISEEGCTLGTTSSDVHRLRGVNLGGWLVLEKWMTPSLFAGLARHRRDAWSAELGAAAANRLRAHWNSFSRPRRLCLACACGHRRPSDPSGTGSSVRISRHQKVRQQSRIPSSRAASRSSTAHSTGPPSSSCGSCLICTRRPAARTASTTVACLTSASGTPARSTSPTRSPCWGGWRRATVPPRRCTRSRC